VRNLGIHLVAGRERPNLRADVDHRPAGLNVVDEKIRAGAFKSFLRYELPQVMGSDVAVPMADDRRGGAGGGGRRARHRTRGDAFLQRREMGAAG
jgi:hypothetical protein